MNIDLASPAHKANPYPFYARLRAEEPVCRVSFGRKQSAWLITRYDDVVAALKDPRFVKDKRNALTPEQTRKEPWMPAITARWRQPPNATRARTWRSPE